MGRPPPGYIGLSKLMFLLNQFIYFVVVLYFFLTKDTVVLKKTKLLL